jgi:acyl-CoA synthetase (AMP-forming)/AMP-acid ligase II
VTESPSSSFSPNFGWLLWQRAAETPDGVALRQRDATTTYAALRDRAAVVSAALQARGLAPGDRVAVFVDQTAEAAAAFFGTLAAGGIAVIANENLRPRQVEHILAHCQAGTLITSESLLARQPRSIDAPAGVMLDLDALPRGGEAEPLARVGMDPAQIIYTSGSSGPPKGVTLSHANHWAAMRAVVSYLGIVAADRIAGILPLSFTYGLNQLVCAVATGASLVVERSPLAQRIVATLREERVTVVAGVPPLWGQLLDAHAFAGEPIPSLRILTCAGGKLPVAGVRALRSSQPQARLFLMYGSTETIRGAFLPPEEVDRHPDSFGRAIPDAELMLINDEGRECAVDEVGELVHRGPTVGLGYWNDPEGTARTFRPNPLRPPGAPEAERVAYSGDLARRDQEGLLYFVARRDRMIKTLGYRVSPDEVAEVLHASGEVVEVVVVGEPDPQRGQALVAYTVLKNGSSLERLEAFAKTELPRYMQPTRYELRTELPRNASGKHDIMALTGRP